VSASKAGRAVRSSCKMMPSDQTSVRASTFLELRNLLGGHVEGRPQDRGRLRHACRFHAGRTESRGLGDPKSSTLTSGDPSARRVRKRFEGLKISVNHAEGVRLGDGFASLQDVVDRFVDWPVDLASATGFPGRSLAESSMTMYGAPPSSRPTSMTRATCSLWIRTARALRAGNLATASGCTQASGRRNLTATAARAPGAGRDDHSHPP